ncbi:BolA family protein [Candidatus Profftia sp. (ex Adelges kitamiensis)]|uniref:BolA family protein n=1 Tax=Candidatus Profftia sp. (ex Adelges kitamiensis) TaxID=2864218 RepID=UPI001CE36418|nr:BolA family protein [Candidatus Profftia sp. (ex Adelges kitamiensis)]
MDNNEIKNLLINALSPQEVYVTCNGNHVQVIIVCEQFIGISNVKKQQVVYAPLMKYIVNSRIHSLSIKALTPKEWQFYYKLNTL